MDVGTKVAIVRANIYSVEDFGLLKRKKYHEVKVSTEHEQHDPIQIIGITDKTIRVSSNSAQYRVIKRSDFGKIIDHRLLTYGRVIYTLADKESIERAVSELEVLIEKSKLETIEKLERTLESLKSQ